jgi:hypothetical protein
MPELRDDPEHNPNNHPDPTIPYLFGNIDQSDEKVEAAWKEFVEMNVIDYALMKIKLQNDKIRPGAPKMIPLSCDPNKNLYCETEYLDDGSISSQCKCNILYSLPVKDRKLSSRGRQDICLGRPWVPCKYKHGSHLLMYATNLDCMPGTTCTALTAKEKLQYRDQKKFHGFGYPPIMAEYMVRQVEKVCKCDEKNKLRPNLMHDCIKVSS